MSQHIAVQAAIDRARTAQEALMGIDRAKAEAAERIEAEFIEAME